MATERPRDTGERERKGAAEETSVVRSERAPRPALPFANPFTFMRRFVEDLDRLFEGFGSGLVPRIELGSRGGESGETMWVPPVEVFEREGQLVIRAEVPGLSKDQIKVEAEDGHLVISGERRQEHEDRRTGLYRSERMYGSFYRAIPLPEGTNPEQARASFANGVLEITMPAPQRARARRIDIREGTEATQSREPKARTGT